MTKIDLTEREQVKIERFRKNLRFDFSITKKQYFDPILGVSIKMCLLPEFESYTFET